MIDNLSARNELYNFGVLYAREMHGKFSFAIGFHINVLMEWLDRNEIGGKDAIARILAAHGFNMDYYRGALAIVREAVADQPGWH